MNPSSLLATELNELEQHKGCSRFFLEYSATSSSYTYYAKGKAVSLYLTQTETVDVIDELSGEKTGEIDSVTNLYADNPLVCDFGLANPLITVEIEQFCNRIVPLIIDPDSGSGVDDGESEGDNTDNENNGGDGDEEGGDGSGDNSENGGDAGGNTDNGDGLPTNPDENGGETGGDEDTDTTDPDNTDTDNGNGDSGNGSETGNSGSSGDNSQTNSTD